MYKINLTNFRCFAELPRPLEVLPITFLVGENSSGNSDNAAPVMEWLLRKNGALIIGGYLKVELERSTKFHDTMTVLSQAGRLHHLDDDKVSKIAEKIKPQCRSNDCHVVAAAIVSGCNLVFTGDKKLHKDLKNKTIVKHSISIYQKKSHKDLLTKCECKV
jgi:hypothetical protein